MTTASDLIKTARQYIGVKESPANSNNVIFNTKYYGREVSGSCYPWCCVFLWHTFKEAGASSLFYNGQRTALCAALGNWFKKKGHFYTSNPQVGDIVFYRFSGGSSNWTNHVGIVTAVNNGSITAIEGNTGTGNDANGGMVMERSRKYPSANIVGFGRPEYAKQSSVTNVTPVTSVTTVTLSYPCKGVDISGYQTNVPYQKFRDAGVKYSILKIIRKDLNIDKGFETHYKGFTDVGIPVVCVYNYSYATTTTKATSDAVKVLQHLGNRKIPVCLDVEDSVQKGLGAKLIDIVNAYGDVITGAGLTFIIYTGMSFYKSYFKPYINNLKYKDFWIARYYAGYKEMAFSQNPTTSYAPNFPEINLIGWQYTSSGKINGYNGSLDLDVLYSPIKNSMGKQMIGVLKEGTKGLNIRSTDSTSGTVLGTYGPNDRIIITGRSEKTGWYLTPRGWISDKYVTIISQ